VLRQWNVDFVLLNGKLPTLKPLSTLGVLVLAAFIFINAKEAWQPIFTDFSRDFEKKINPNAR
jgi:hypothetical protein